MYVYKRPEHTLKTLEHLERSLQNSNIDKLYIFQDGLKKNEDYEQWKRVNEIINKIDFIKTELIVSESNKGLANSIIDGINYVFVENDRVITIEDDCCVAKEYFEFMNGCFDKYEKNERVMCVSGYSWPISVPESYAYDVYFSYRMSSIGWGTWKNRWKKYSRSYDTLKEIIQDEKKREIFKIAGEDVESIIYGQLKGKCDSWAIFWQLIQNNNLGVCVQPVQSVAEDIGRDGSGSNTVVETHLYDTILYEGEINKFKLPDEIISDDFINKEITNIFKIITSESRLQQYYELMNIWIENLHKGLSLKKYLEGNKKSKKYIYGCGKLAERLIEEVEKYVIIDGFIVENFVQDKFHDYNVISINNYEKYNDALIIVTPIYDYDSIVRKLSKNSRNFTVVSLEKLIKEEML